MPRLLTTTFLTLAALGLARGAAADITAAALWSAWKAQAAAYGKTVTAATTENTGTGMILRDVTSTARLVGGGTATAHFDQVLLQNTGSGVSIALPAAFAVEMKPDAATPRAVPTDVQVTLEGQDIFATGTPDAVEYTYNFERIAFVAEADDPTRPDSGSKASGDLVKLKGAARALPGTAEAPAEMTFDFAAASWSSIIAGPDSTVSNVSKFGPTEVIARPYPSGNPDQPVAGTAKMTSGAGTQDFSTQSPTTAFDYHYASTGSRGELDLTAETLRAVSSVTKARVDLNMRSAGLPPLGFDLGTITVDGFLPLEPETASPFRMSLDLGPLTADDATWAVFDPNQAIDRSPGQLRLNLSGNMAMAPSSPAPGAPMARVPVSLGIEDLLLGLGGALLTGKGALNLAPTGMPGMAPPEGTLSLALEGGQQLLQALSTGGILPPEQLMGAQMMLGMFARPDGTGDRLKSDIVFGPGGTVNVNGVQVR